MLLLAHSEPWLLHRSIGVVAARLGPASLSLLPGRHCLEPELASPGCGLPKPVRLAVVLGSVVAPGLVGDLPCVDSFPKTCLSN